MKKIFGISFLLLGLVLSVFVFFASDSAVSMKRHSQVRENLEDFRSDSTVLPMDSVTDTAGLAVDAVDSSVALMDSAPDPMDLLSQNACVWGAYSDEGDSLVLAKGCPKYYSGMCKEMTAKFRSEKVGGKNVLTVDWEWRFPKFGKDSLNVKGKTQFVVGYGHGEWNLYVYKIQADCAGKCDIFDVVGDAHHIRELSPGANAPSFFSPPFGGDGMDIGIENAVEYTQYECGDPRCELAMWDSDYSDSLISRDSLARLVSRLESKAVLSKDGYDLYYKIRLFYDFLVPLARVDCKEK